MFVCFFMLFMRPGSIEFDRSSTTSTNTATTNALKKDGCGKKCLAYCKSVVAGGNIECVDRGRS